MPNKNNETSAQVLQDEQQEKINKMKREKEEFDDHLNDLAIKLVTAILGPNYKRKYKRYV